MDNSEIKAEVTSWLLDLPTGASTRIQGWVNEAIKAACRRHNFRCMEAEVSASTALETRELVAVPANWKERRGDPYYYRQDGSTAEFDWAPSESEMLRSYAIALPAEGNTTPADVGPPRYLLEREATLDLFPLPDEESDWDNGNYRVVVPYWAYLDELSDDADTNHFTERHEYYCIWKAVALGFAWARDEERASLYEAKAEPLYLAAERKDKRSRLGDRLTLATNRDVYAGRPRSGGREG